MIIRAPHRVKNIFIENFVNAKMGWIEKNLEKIKKNSPKKNFSKTEIAEMKKNLKKYIIPRTREIWQQTDFPEYISIKITTAETRWGSCSSRNSLNFSYRLAEFLGKNKDFIDAVIVHELCHLKEKNHSANFWNLVYKFCPNYENIVKNKNNLD